MLLFNMKTRKEQLIAILQRAGRVGIQEQARAFGVSAMTIRRDLQALEDEGLAWRVHGGAVLRERTVDAFFATGDVTAERRRIAARVLALLGPAPGTVMLSTGRTTQEIARQMVAAPPDCTVVTNSLPVSGALFGSGIEVILLGGTLRSGFLDLVGPITERNLDGLHIDILVTGCDGAVADKGFFTGDLNMAAMEEKSVRLSDRVIVATESFKFEKKSFARFARPTEVSCLVTDRGLSARDRQVMEDAGIEVIIA